MPNRKFNLHGIRYGQRLVVEDSQQIRNVARANDMGYWHVVGRLLMLGVLVPRPHWPGQRDVTVYEVRRERIRALHRWAMCGACNVVVEPEPADYRSRKLSPLYQSTLTGGPNGSQ